ncbi:MAG: hypothetical protein M1820_001636 [Bogoriella megaspora]|nr:MAG: hypothetical protein M1820_001636 [Bogoriella megaspora]
MATTRRKNKAEDEIFQEPTPPSQDEVGDAPDDEEMFADSDGEKDTDEEELERLVFGDSAGFRDSVKNFNAIESTDEDEGRREEDDDDKSYAALEDADLFFTDTGSSAPQQNALVPAPESEDGDSVPEKDRPAWEDSDDERMMVSLATVPRLQKLRNYEGEDLINGKEYIKRLRRQFELLNPVPEWAKYAVSRPPRKRRKSHAQSQDSSENDDSSASEMDINSGTISAQPLASLLRDASALTRSPSSTFHNRKLRPGVIDIQRQRDITDPGPSSITSLSFHPTLPLLLSSGPSSTLSLHHVLPSGIPTPNPLLTSLHIKNTPLSSTVFHPSTPRIFFSGRRRYFHVWDLQSGAIEKVSRIYGHQHEQKSMEILKPSPCGRYIALQGSSRKGGGVVNVLDATTLQWIAQARVESRGGTADFCWWGDGEGLVVLGKAGEVVEWEVERRKVVGRWVDEGMIGATVIAVGGPGKGGKGIGGDRWVAVGSQSGVVNVYDRRAWIAGSKRQVDGNADLEGEEDEENAVEIPRDPKPTKSFDQLTTAIGHLTFSPDGQLLVMGSSSKKDALRLIHLPSCTVYRNWPTSNSRLGRVSVVAVGEVKNQDDGKDALYLSAANDTGRIKLWEIRA